MHNFRSDKVTHGKAASASRSLWMADGMKQNDFGKPIIAVANSFTEFVPGHVHLQKVGRLVCNTIWQKGGVPREFNTIAIDADKLSIMKKTSVLINTGHGGLVDESALLNVLEDNELAAAGLDVLQDDPKVTEGLKSLDNVTLLPHIGSATIECRTNMLHTALKNIEDYVLGQYENMNTVYPTVPKL